MTSFFRSVDHYKEIKTLTSKDHDYFSNLFIDKVVQINRNPDLTESDFKTNVVFLSDKTRFISSNQHSEFVTFVFYIDFFGVEIEANSHLYFNEKGKFTDFIFTYKGKQQTSSSFVMKVLDIDFFKNDYSILEFDINRQYEDWVYDIIRVGDIKLPTFPSTITTLTYHFNKDHKVDFKSVEISNKSSSTNLGIDAFEKFESELLFLDFIKAVLSKKEAFDSDLCNYDTLDFHGTEWIKYFHKQFIFLLTGDNRNKFLDYMKVIEMEQY